MNIVRKLRAHALQDPSDEREVLHAPLLKKAADRIEQLEAGIRGCHDVMMDSVVTHGTQGGWLHTEAKLLEALLTPNVK